LDKIAVHTGKDRLEYQPDAVADGWYFYELGLYRKFKMTNYQVSLPEPDDESAEAMMRPPEQEPGQEPEPKPKPRRRLRSLFWPGFIFGFLLLAVASCGGLVLATGINSLDLADLQNDGQVWAPPQVTATPVETPAVAEAPIVGEAGGAFTVGQRLSNITASQVNIRAAPGYLSKPGGDIIGQVPPGGAVEVIGGHTAADGLTWWYIRYATPDGASIDGWIAEATASGVQILGQ
jgi:hypothetical protein